LFLVLYSSELIILTYAPEKIIRMINNRKLKMQLLITNPLFYTNTPEKNDFNPKNMPKRIL
jgi:hypothetical protein